MKTNEKLSGKNVAFIVTDGFEQVELTGPRKALDDAGATTTLISLKIGKVLGFNHLDKGDAFDVDKAIGDVKASEFDAVVLPGGVINPDALRGDVQVQAFVREIFESGKPVAAICHGPWTLIDAKVVAGKKITSWPSLKTDLMNAGAEWLDKACVVDAGLITSRKPADIPKFNEKIIEALLPKS